MSVIRILTHGLLHLGNSEISKLDILCQLCWSSCVIHGIWNLRWRTVSNRNRSPGYFELSIWQVLVPFISVFCTWFAFLFFTIQEASRMREHCDICTIFIYCCGRLPLWSRFGKEAASYPNKVWHIEISKPPPPFFLSSGVFWSLDRRKSMRHPFIRCFKDISRIMYFIFWF